MQYPLQFRGEAVEPAPFYIWGIVNTTPDSFYDGGCYEKADRAAAHARQLWEQGACILDIGGASSRPGAQQDVSSLEEWQRIAPVISAVQEFSGHAARSGADRIRTDIVPLQFAEKPLISIDTWRAEVAEKALEKGVEIINDISAFEWEPELLSVVAAYKPMYVLMHCQGRPQTMQDTPVYKNVVQEVYAFFEEKMNILVQKGLPEENIILDFGIGFGKSLEHNLALLHNIAFFETLKRPLLLGLSQKSMFGHLLGQDKHERSISTQVCTALAMEKGICHHRVHEVKETLETLALTYAVQNIEAENTGNNR